MAVRVSVPGKTILIGEHAAVYGRPALVAAVDRRLTVEIAGADSPGVRLELPQVGVSATVAWEEVHRCRREARQAWEAGEGDPRSGDPRSGDPRSGDPRSGDPARLVKIALGEAAAWLGEEDAGPGLALALDSRIPIGAGFGSSAAVAVAVSAAFLAFRGRRPSQGELHRLTLEVERRQHGRPSGVDNAAVIHGGLVWAERDARGELGLEPLAAPPWLERLRVFHSGPPGESTGAVVAAVGRRFADRRQDLEVLLGRMEAATRGLREALGTADPGDRPLALVSEFEACLEELGVVPPAVRELIRRIEARGGAAKISGAGSLAGPGAGSLLVYPPRAGEIAGWDFLAGLECLDLRLGAPGVRVEEDCG